MIRSRCLSALLLGLWATAAYSQAGTDIYLLNLKALAKNQFVLVRVTDAPGYENQPHFSADSKTLFFTKMVDGQTDIYQYGVSNAQLSPVLQSPQSEYSPTPIPRQYAISVIRVEDDGRQRLWALPLNDEPPRLIFENIEPVGYQAWAAPRLALLFVLGEPMTLQLAGPAGIGITVAENIGRALVPVPNTTAVAYVRKDAQTRWAITAYDYAVDEHRYLATTLGENEDFTIAPDGSLWTGEGPRLYQWTRDTPAWTLRADLSEQGLINITRMAVSPDGQSLALVTDETMPPDEPPFPIPLPASEDASSEL